MSAKHYDYFVIGGGSGGVRSARIAGSLGAKVGLAESRDLGGTCVNVGCVPKKLMTYAAGYHADFEDAQGYGWSVGGTAFDWSAFVANKNKEINRLNGIYKNLLENSGVTIHPAHARFLDARTVQVGGDVVTADKFLIATGGRPRPGSFPGTEHAIVSDDAFYLKDLPGHILIVGGGYIAVEFAHIFSSLGSKVTLIYRGDLFLRGFDTDIRQALADEMRKQDITINFNYYIEHIDKKEKLLSVKMHDGKNLDYDAVLLAIGREPNIKDLGLEAAGVKITKAGKIAINDRYQTSQPHIYALGDVANQFNLTPVATAEGQALAQTLFGRQEKLVNYRNIPTAVFSRPPIGAVGLTEEQARAEGYAVTCYKTRFRPMKNTISGRDEYTLMKLVVDAKTDKVLGVHMIGADAPEILQGFAVALNAGATKADFDRTIGIHPTAAEEFVTMRQAV